MTIATIKQANVNAGCFFFEPSAMRFFRSRVCADVFEGPGGIYFVTSEQFEASDGWRAARRYTVHGFDPATGHIRGHDAFQKHATRRSALRAAKRASLNQ